MLRPCAAYCVDLIGLPSKSARADSSCFCFISASLLDIHSLGSKQNKHTDAVLGAILIFPCGVCSENFRIPHNSKRESRQTGVGERVCVASVC